MNNTYVRSLLSAALVAVCVLASGSYAVPVAFPGAEGSGRFSTGGRGGTVYEVTNLNNSGAGSIVDAVSQPNRTVVFRVSGTIGLGSTILTPKSNITIAGQTAPGDGICLKGRLQFSGVSNVIVRYIRIRVDAGAANSAGDGIDISTSTNIIVDHCTASYARDEGISATEASDYVTVQWCIISESLNFENHSFGSLIRGDYGDRKTYHHNLYAHNRSRNPRPGNYTGIVSDPEGMHFDFRNNVVYNWIGSYGGYNDDGAGYVTRYNFIGNAYFPGLDSTNNNKGFRESSKDAYGYFADNSYNDVVPGDPWNFVVFNGNTMQAADITAYKARSYLITMEPVTTTSPAQAKIDVLAGAGASYPKRDIIDARIVNDVLNKTGHIINTIADQPEGAWPTLNSLPAPTDTDHDGMPDAWETAHGLNPTNAADRNGYSFSTDYTNLEVYLNGLIGSDATAPTPNPMTWATAPYAISPTSVGMVASTATDISGVEYIFTCTAGGGHSSAWQDGTTYIDTGLAPSSLYTYTVTARDKSTAGNATASSSPASASTSPDSTAPTPNPMTWAVEPNATGISSITMTATTATDISGVEYFFANVTDPNHNSAWQDSATYTDTGLANNTTYTYRVISRDKSIAGNETGWSAGASATTFRYVCTVPIASDLNGNCQVDFLDLALIGDTWVGDVTGWTGLAQFATDWLTCNRNPAGECWQ
jgi:hypothetical protein